MTRLILICAFATACATTVTDDGTNELDPQVSSSAEELVDVDETEALDRLDGAAAAGVVYEDCHGTTECPGELDLGGAWVNVACGPQVCGSHSCGRGDRTSREQHHELRKAYSHNCFVYKPTFPSYGLCNCTDIIE